MRYCKRCNHTGFSGKLDWVWSVQHTQYLVRKQYCLCVTKPELVKPDEWGDENETNQP